jgi:hypothetical protein
MKVHFVWRVCVSAGRLAALFGGFRPGQGAEAQRQLFGPSGAGPALPSDAARPLATPRAVPGDLLAFGRDGEALSCMNLKFTGLTQNLGQL